MIEIGRGVISVIVTGSVTGSEVVCRSYRKPAKNVDGKLVDEGSHSLRTVGCIAELFEESRDVAGLVALPCHERDSFHKVVSRCELFCDGILDPVFDLRCDIVVCGWTERAEQVANLRSKDRLSIMITRFGYGSTLDSTGGILHGCMMEKSVAGAWPDNTIQRLKLPVAPGLVA